MIFLLAPGARIFVVCDSGSDQLAKGFDVRVEEVVRAASQIGHLGCPHVDPQIVVKRCEDFLEVDGASTPRRNVSFYATVPLSIASSFIA